MKLLKQSETQGIEETELVLICEDDNVDRLKKVGLQMCAGEGVADAIWIANSRGGSNQELMADGKILFCIRR